MKFYRIYLALLISFSLSVLMAQNEEIINDVFQNRGEVYFKFKPSSSKDIVSLTRVISIDNVKKDEVFAYANKKEFNDFLNYGIDYTVLPAPGFLINPKMKSVIDIKGVLDWDFYPTYEAYIDMMNQFQTNYPNLCQVYSIGQTLNGRELLVARISDNIGQDEGEAQFLYTATMHGDETAGYVLMLRLIDYLLSNYGTDPQVDNLVNNLDIYINPLANPDGTYLGGNSSVYGAQRENGNNIDLNRNYPDPEDGPHPDGNEWQPETVAFMAFAESHHFVLSANFHGGAEVFNYPWDTWATLAADDEWWQYTGREWADSVQVYSPSGYFTDLNNGITNGYAWYSISGGRQDYMNYFHQCREVTIELSNEKLVPASQLPDFWDYQYRSFLDYMEQTLFGIRGTITDAATGDPVYAEIYIENHEADSSWLYSLPSTGDYYRPVFEGTYDVTYSAFGYYSQTIENIQVQNREITWVDIELEQGNLIPDFSASITTVSSGGSVDFTDISYGNVTSWEWTFEGGTPPTSDEQNPTGIVYNTNGTYDVTLTISDGTDSETITKEDYITVSTEYFMQDGTVTTCEGVFYDSGGQSVNYSDDEDFIMTFLPGNNGSMVKAEFLSFSVENQSNCEYDWLKIFDGPNNQSAQIGIYCGTNSPGTVVATNDQGALTFQFHSDYAVNEPGWVANITCEGGDLPPAADFSANPTQVDEGNSVQFTDLSENNPTTWSWTFEGGTPETSDEQNPEITYNTPGVYDVALTVTNDYGSDTKTKNDFITVIHVTGVDMNSVNQIKIFPNPANDILNINSEEIIHSVTLLDIVGAKVYQQDKDVNSLTINTSVLKAGIYFVVIKTDSGVITRKVQIL